MIRTSLRGLAVAGVAAGALLALAPAASAHPLGNFTVNSADRIVVQADTVRVEHVLDIAEIPTLQLAQAPDGPDANGDGTASAEELTAWSGRECATLASGLSLTLDGRAAPLTVVTAAARSVPGQAGLPTTRVDCTLDAGRSVRDTVAFSDPTASGRTGWKEVSATALCGRLAGPTPPDASPSQLLTVYPKDLLSSPLAVTTASFSVQQGSACRAEASGVPAPSSVLPRGVDRVTTAYTRFVGRQHLTLPVALLAVLFSVMLGCGHAVAPGHGKTVIAAYLVGQRGTRRQAVWLGATVTATHTAGVLLLGALLSLTSIASPERFVPATEVASGLLLGGVGVFLLRRTLRQRRAATAWGHEHGDHDHGQHDDHGHDHGPHEDHGHDHGPQDDGHDHGDHGHDHGDHDHDHGGHDHPDAPARELVTVGAEGVDTAQAAVAPHVPAPRMPVVHSHGGKPHSHLPPEDAPISWRTLATMGVAGGLVPSPSALVVLLGAAALGRPVFGALLVVGYGLGMAITLTVAGLLLLRARSALAARGWGGGGRAATALRVLPLVTAAVVLVVGGTVVVRGLLTFHSLG